MKTVATCQPETKRDDEITYPCLMYRDDQSGGAYYVVLFTGRSAGTVVYAGTGHHSLGYWTSAWSTSGFKPFVGKVQIETSQS